MNRLVNPASLPEPRGFSHAVESEGGRTLWVAGQTGDRPDGTMPDSLAEQFGAALAKVGECLTEAGFPPESLVRMLIYTTDVDEYKANLAELGAAYRQVLGHHYPAIALFGVTHLFDPAAKVELVCTAVL